MGSEPSATIFIGFKLRSKEDIDQVSALSELPDNIEIVYSGNNVNSTYKSVFVCAKNTIQNDSNYGDADKCLDISKINFEDNIQSCLDLHSFIKDVGLDVSFYNERVFRWYMAACYG